MSATPTGAEPTLLPVAVRVYAERTDVPPRRGAPRAAKGWPETVLIFDTETTVDAAQRLLFGCWRQCQWAEDGTLVCVSEGLFYDDELETRDPDGFRLLCTYAKSAKADVAPGHDDTLCLMSRTEFVRAVFYPLAYSARALVVGFNLPFDITRLAVQWGTGRDGDYNNFSLTLDLQIGASPGWKPVEAWWRPRIMLKMLDSKKAFINFATPMKLNAQDAEPAEPGSGRRFWPFRGRFLDLRTLTHALTGASHSLASACEAFGTAHAKKDERRHGKITKRYIDYNRRDVLITGELLVALRQAFDAHELHLDPCHAYSPASLGKAYMRKFGVTPPAQQFASLPRELLGLTMNGYHGGRADDRIRKTAVPIVHTDFTSQYPTVNALMGLWDVITAEEILVEDYTEEANRQLQAATVDRYFDPAAWKDLLWFGEILPDGDVLPVRAPYRESSKNLGIGVNAFTSQHPSWFAAPDLVASTLLAGKAPVVRKAFRMVPRGRQGNLQSVSLGGTPPIDPSTQDFFRAIVEEKERIGRDQSLSKAQRKAGKDARKLLANSVSYGIFVEMNPEELPKGETRPVRVYSHGRSYDTEIPRPERPGDYCFPPVAVLITAASRLTLALLERVVTDAGGFHAFCDTDSMAIVATQTGGLVRCAGGPLRSEDGSPCIRALSWAQVQAIVDRFERLNPYDRTAVPGSILRVEKVSQSTSGKLREIWVYAISAKRYAFFQRIGRHIRVLKPSEHGLGHLLNPERAADIEERDREEPWPWIRKTWEYVITRALRLAPPTLPFLTLPALCRINVSSPHVLRPFAEAQRDLPTPERIRPTNFLLSANVEYFSGPTSQPFHLIRPFTTDQARWLTEPWTDLYSGTEYRVTTDFPALGGKVGIKSYADVIHAFEHHPEAKSADEHGVPCTQSTVGLLQRRHIECEYILPIGKEANRIEDVEKGLVHSQDDVLTIYADSELDPWKTGALPRLRELPEAVLIAATGMTARALRDIRSGRSMPSAETRKKLWRLLRSERHSPRPATLTATRQANR